MFGFDTYGDHSLERLRICEKTGMVLHPRPHRFKFEAGIEGARHLPALADYYGWRTLDGLIRETVRRATKRFADVRAIMGNEISLVSVVSLIEGYPDAAQLAYLGSTLLPYHPNWELRCIRMGFLPSGEVVYTLSYVCDHPEKLVFTDTMTNKIPL